VKSFFHMKKKTLGTVLRIEGGTVSYEILNMFRVVAGTARNVGVVATWGKGLWVSNGTRVNAGGAAATAVATFGQRKALHTTLFCKKFYFIFITLNDSC